MLWKSYALTTVALFLKMFTLAGVQGFNRVKYRTFVRPDLDKFERFLDRL